MSTDWRLDPLSVYSQDSDHDHSFVECGLFVNEQSGVRRGPASVRITSPEQPPHVIVSLVTVLVPFDQGVGLIWYSFLILPKAHRRNHLSNPREFRHGALCQVGPCFSIGFDLKLVQNLPQIIACQMFRQKKDW